MATKEILIKGLDCKCNECFHSWIVPSEMMPVNCPACNSDQWNEIYHSAQKQNNDVGLSRAEQENLARQAVKQGFYRLAERPPKTVIVTVNK